MTPRKFVWTTLHDPRIAELVGGQDDVADARIFAKKTLTSNKEDCPYIVYKLGNDTSEEFSEEREITRQFFQVWVHDFTNSKIADYGRIDALLKVIKQVFKETESQPGIWTCRYLETSQDLDDDTLDTVFRYLRFQLIREDT
jgi:hypothetical protein